MKNKKTIPRQLAEICEHTYKEGFMDAVELFRKGINNYSDEYFNNLLEEAIKKTRKSWEMEKNEIQINNQ